MSWKTKHRSLYYLGAPDPEDPVIDPRQTALLAATGLATRDMPLDNDGRGEPETIGPGQVADLEALLEDEGGPKVPRPPARPERAEQDRQAEERDDRVDQRALPLNGTYEAGNWRIGQKKRYQRTSKTALTPAKDATSTAAKPTGIFEGMDETVFKRGMERLFRAVFGAPGQGSQ